MSNQAMTSDDIGVEAGGRILRVGDAVLAPGQIKHIIVNQDTNLTDSWAGSVVVETVPSDKPGSALSPNQVQTDVTSENTLAEVKFFSSANNISMTSTSLENDRFHDMFWL